MTAVEKIIHNQAEKCRIASHNYLRKAAEETIFYVALGRCLKREMAEKFGITEEQAGNILSVVAVGLVDKIRSLGE